MSKLTLILGQKLTRNFGSNMFTRVCGSILPGLRRWHIDQDPGYDLTQFGLNLIRTFLECVLAMKLIEETIYSSSIRVFSHAAIWNVFQKP